MRLTCLVVLFVAASSFAGERLLKNDNFTGSGAIYSGLSLPEYAGAGVAFTPAPADYPLTIIGVDVLLVSAGGGSAGATGLYVLDIWDEVDGPVDPPRKPDGGARGQGRLQMQGVQFTTSTTMFNRFTLPSPLTVTSGKVFVQVSEQLDTATDGTTIALDTGPLQPNANWYFDGTGRFAPLALPDGGFTRGLNRNWIIRLVLRVPDMPVAITSVSPSSGPNTRAVPISISGTGFELGAKVFLGTTELALTGLTGVLAQATVPAGVAPGRYDVVVRNSGGTEGRAANAYTALEADGGTGGGSGGSGGGTGAGGSGGATGGSGGTAGAMGTQDFSLTDITPAQAYENDSAKIIVTGSGFQTGAQLLIGTKVIEFAVVKSPSVLSATIDAKTLTKGIYDVTLINLDGARATLPQAFSVQAGTATKTGCSCQTVEPGAVLLIFAALIRRRRASSSAPPAS